jgi:hypothetical protein
MFTRDYPNHPWIIRRNDKECARARTRAEADPSGNAEGDRIITQLRKIYRTASFGVHYAGANLSHCGPGGKPLG